MRLSGEKSYNSITLHRQTMLPSINFKFGIWNFELNPKHSKKLCKGKLIIRYSRGAVLNKYEVQVTKLRLTALHAIYSDCHS